MIHSGSSVGSLLWDGVQTMKRQKDLKPAVKPASGLGTSSKPGAKPPEAAFDVWLQRGLHKLYDTVANEPIPDDLLRLIENDGKKR